MIALVRHAAAGERRAGDDELRALTAKGRAQATNLVRQLASVKLARIVSSPYVRCRQTFEPLAAARGLPLEDLGLLGEGNSGAQLLKLLPELAAAGTALCSHGDVIGEIVDELVERGLVRPDQARFGKGSTWLLELSGGTIRSARYLPPDP